jgi:hypothetical protein
VTNRYALIEPDSTRQPSDPNLHLLLDCETAVGLPPAQRFRLTVRLVAVAARAANDAGKLATLRGLWAVFLMCGGHVVTLPERLTHVYP